MPVATSVRFLCVATVLLAACSSRSEPPSLAATDERPVLLIEKDSADLSPTESADDPDKPVLVIPEEDESRSEEAEPPPPSDGTADAAVDVDLPIIVYDTDLGPDIDDALGLAMLHAYQKRGMAEIGAVTLSRHSPMAAQFVDGVNTFYGRPDIPIGNGPKDSPYFSDSQTYVSLASSWPNDIVPSELETSLRVLRRTLADALAAGRPVRVVQVGFATNIADLLDSGGDDISPLTGVELVTQSGAQLSIMSGTIDLSFVEFNVEKDVASAKATFARWPGPLVLSPFELGYNIHYPHASITRDFGWVDRHPIVEAYEFRDLTWHHDAPPYYDMRSWDLTSVIEAVEPDQHYFRSSGAGTVTLDGAGHTSFAPGSGRHRVLHEGQAYSSTEKERVVARMIDLVSEPT